MISLQKAKFIDVPAACTRENFMNFLFKFDCLSNGWNWGRWGAGLVALGNKIRGKLPCKVLFTSILNFDNIWLKMTLLVNSYPSQSMGGLFQIFPLEIHKYVYKCKMRYIIVNNLRTFHCHTQRQFYLGSALWDFVTATFSNVIKLCVQWRLSERWVWKNISL